MSSRGASQTAAPSATATAIASADDTASMLVNTATNCVVGAPRTPQTINLKLKLKIHALETFKLTRSRRH